MTPQPEPTSRMVVQLVEADGDAPHGIEVHLDQILTDRGMTLAELADRVGISPVNLSRLKTGKARAIRFTTLTALCAVLECTPGDLLTCSNNDPGDDDSTIVCTGNIALMTGGGGVP